MEWINFCDGNYEPIDGREYVVYLSDGAVYWVLIVSTYGHILRYITEKNISRTMLCSLRY